MISAPQRFAGDRHYSPERSKRLDKWSSLAAEADPFLEAIERAYEQEVAADAVTQWIEANRGESVWLTSRMLRPLPVLATAAAHPQSSHRGRADLINACSRLVEEVFSRMLPEGTWLEPGRGDANTNRFILVNLVQGLVMLDDLAGDEERFDSWRSDLAAAVEYQRKSYAPGSPLQEWDFGARFSPHYANMDAAYIAILGGAAKVLDRPELAVAAHRRIELLHNEVLPGGGLHYLQNMTETPSYHSLNVKEIAIYHDATVDPSAEALLRRMGAYAPTVLTADGDPEMWTSPWYKQTWMQQWRDGGPSPWPFSRLAILAHAQPPGALRDRLRSLMWASLSRVEPRLEQQQGRSLLRVPAQLALAVDHWPTGPAVDLSPPSDALVYDLNRRGLRGHHDGWYYGVAKGRGQRSTLVGGMVTQAGETEPLKAVLRGAWVEVYPQASASEDLPRRWHGVVAPSPRGWPLRLSLDDPDVNPGLSWHGLVAAGGARYSLQPSRFGDRSDLRESPWSTTQTWLAGPFGILGRIEVEANQEALPAAAVWRIAVGPNAVTRGDERFEVADGSAAVRLFSAPGSGVIEPWSDILPKSPGVEPWPSIVAEAPLESGGRREVFVWFGPMDADPPSDVDTLDGLTDSLVGWRAQWPDGSRLGLVYNASLQPIDFDLGSIGTWSRATMFNQSLSPEVSLSVTLPAGGVILLADDKEVASQ